jgi:hypothetical protein
MFICDLTFVARSNFRFSKMSEEPDPSDPVKEAIKRGDITTVESFFKDGRFPEDLNESLRHAIMRRDESMAQLVHDEMEKQSIALDSMSKVMWTKMASKSANRGNKKK